MRKLDEILVPSHGTISLHTGDLAAIPPAEAVDLLVVSAFPGHYSPTPKSLVGALDRAGVSLESLARRKAVDLRAFSSCWLSEEVPTANGFRRILCFEPGVGGRAPQVVGDIFRSIIPFAGGEPPIRSIAMPLVAAGDQGESKFAMLEAIVDAAVHWFSIGLPLGAIKIVVREGRDVPALHAIFAGAKSRFALSAGPASAAWKYDAFVSYSHLDRLQVEVLVEAIGRARPGARLFLDRLELQPGAGWQQHLYDAIERSHKVIACLSPPYLQSKVCIEEYNIAHFRNRESEGDVLTPVYLRTSPLPTYMKLVQFIDAREDDSARLVAAAQTIAASL